MRVELDSLRRNISEIFRHPKELGEAAISIAQRVAIDLESARALVAELVVAHWIHESIVPPTFDRPIFIISAPRSGSNLLFEQMCKIPGIWSIGGESHEIFDGVLQHKFNNPAFDSIRATAADATDERTRQLIHLFSRRLIAHDGHRYADLPLEARPQAIRFLDKLPKNSFRVPFLNASFRDAQFVYLSREPRGNISSIIDAWRESRNGGRFVTYRRLPGTTFENWCFVLPPGWRSVVHDEVAEIAAFQWAQANETALNDLLELPRQRWCAISYSDLIAKPSTELQRICEFISLQFNAEAMGIANGKLAVSRTALTPPEPNKWRKNEAEIERVMPRMETVSRRIEDLFARRHAAASAHHP